MLYSMKPYALFIWFFAMLSSAYFGLEAFNDFRDNDESDVVAFLILSAMLYFCFGLTKFESTSRYLVCIIILVDAFFILGGLIDLLDALDSHPPDHDVWRYIDGPDVLLLMVLTVLSVVVLCTGRQYAQKRAELVAAYAESNQLGGDVDGSRDS